VLDKRRTNGEHGLIPDKPVIAGPIRAVSSPVVQAQLSGEI
jgi:hypothetical protein